MNQHPVASALLVVLAVYAGVGVLFALWFVHAGAARLDPAVPGSSRGFRFIIAPGAAALWPVLVLRVARGPSPSAEPHRRVLP